MASNHTEHFSLNQWLPDDQVKRTDFNADNKIIDLYLAERIPMAVLHDITLTEKKNRLEFDIKAEGWSKYTTLMLSYMPVQGNNGVVKFNIGDTDTSSRHWEIGRGNAVELDCLATAPAHYSATMIFFPGGQTTYVQALTIATYELQFGYSAQGYHTSPLILSGTTMEAGTRIRVLGIL